MSNADFPLADDVRDEDIIEGSRLAVSGTTENVYEVTAWVEQPGAGKIRALRKRELSHEEIDELSIEQRRWIDQRLEEIREQRDGDD
jgi:hypothetical protein